LEEKKKMDNPHVRQSRRFMSKLLNLLSALISYVAVATLITQLVLMGVFAAAGYLTKDKFYGALHGSDDGETLVCNKDTHLDENWFIVDNASERIITCKKCLKKLIERQRVNTI